jgi:hypothetical protein
MIPSCWNDVPLDHNKHQPPNTQTARPSGSRRLRPLCARRCPSGAAHALCLSLSRNHMTAAPNSVMFHDKIAHLSTFSPPPLQAQWHEQQVLHATDRWLTTTHYPLSLHRPPSMSMHRDPTRTRTRTRHTDSQPPPDRRMPRRLPHAHPTPNHPDHSTRSRALHAQLHHHRPGDASWCVSN